MINSGEKRSLLNIMHNLDSLSGPARGFGYKVSWAFLFQVYGIFWSKFGYKVFIHMNVVPRSTGNTNNCVPSATRHNIHMYPYFLFAAIHHLKSSPTFSVRPCSSVGRVTVDLFRRSWVRFPPRSKDFFFASCGSLFPFTRANAQ